MGSFFRSEEMSLCQLFIQPEAAYTFVSRAGEAGIAQFRDLNEDLNSFQRKFVGEVRRCEEMERKLRYIEAEIKKVGLNIPDVDGNPRAPNAREATELEAQLERTESEIMELSENAVNLKSNYLEVIEYKHVLEKTHVFFEQQEGDAAGKSLISEEGNQASRGRLGFVAGVVRRERVPAFERMLWRISRGNVFLRQAEIHDPFTDPATGNDIFKTVFVAFFQGEQLKTRVQKVCNGFHATMYQTPTSYGEREAMLAEVKTRILDLQLVLNQTDDHRQKVLVAVAKEISMWNVLITKMKAIYFTMNYFNMDVTQKCLIGECWVPTNDLPVLNRALMEGSKDVGSTTSSVLHPISTNKIHPTFNRCNKFTQGFQNLIDAYGVATYREVNPALFTVITFPFLFAVMFGDLGHGFILALFGAYMCIWEKSLVKKKIKSEIWTIFFGGRYIILLMGMFSMYTGGVYNDIFSKSMAGFPSSWVIRNLSMDTIMSNNYLTLDPKYQYENTPYPFGFDPVWQMADNKIVFQNSFKMKLSIIFGVIHMLFGISLSIANNLHFKNRIYILFDFLPQFLFLSFIFLYLVILMIMKWFMYSAENDIPTSPGCAPQVLILFIHMIMFTGADKPTDPHCLTTLMYNGQETVQAVLMVLALLCVPVMLMAKPIYLIKYKKNEHSQAKISTDNAIELQNGSAGAIIGNQKEEDDDHDENEHEESTGDIIIHQMIHVIEFVLSTISHTASYLRLWALSLAHGQLSEVLWTMVLNKGLTQKSQVVGVIMLFLVFGAWAILTLAILVTMEGLSAFLHTLRLHWVEFMSKFYSGTGYPFQPFSFKRILAEEEES